MPIEAPSNAPSQAQASISPRPAPPLEEELSPLIKARKVQITKDGPLQVISVLGPNQYEVSGTYDCWIHAPFNAWRLFEGDSIQSFTGDAWLKDLKKRVVDFKSRFGFEGNTGGNEGGCLHRVEILKPLRESEDFSYMGLEGTTFQLNPLRGIHDGIQTGVNINSVLLIDDKYLNKDTFEHFQFDAQGKKDLTEFTIFLNKCSEQVQSEMPSSEMIKRYNAFYNCMDMALVGAANGVSSQVRSLVEAYRSGKIAQAIASVITYYNYRQVILSAYQWIKRFKSGHDLFGNLSLNNPEEYYVHHVMAVKVLAPDASKIIVINSEPRHIGAIKTLKALHKILTVPLPEELGVTFFK